MSVDSKTIFDVMDTLKGVSSFDSHSFYSQQITQIQLQKAFQLHYPLPTLSTSRSYLFTESVYLYPVCVKLSFKSNAHTRSPPPSSTTPSFPPSSKRCSTPPGA